MNASLHDDVSARVAFWICQDISRRIKIHRGITIHWLVSDHTKTYQRYQEILGNIGLHQGMSGYIKDPGAVERD